MRSEGRAYWNAKHFPIKHRSCEIHNTAFVFKEKQLSSRLPEIPISIENLFILTDSVYYSPCSACAVHIIKEACVKILQNVQVEWKPSCALPNDVFLWDIKALVSNLR